MKTIKVTFVRVGVLTALDLVSGKMYLPIESVDDHEVNRLFIDLDDDIFSSLNKDDFTKEFHDAVESIHKKILSICRIIRLESKTMPVLIQVHNRTICPTTQAHKTPKPLP